MTMDTTMGKEKLLEPECEELSIMTASPREAIPVVISASKLRGNRLCGGMTMKGLGFSNAELPEKLYGGFDLLHYRNMLVEGWKDIVWTGYESAAQCANVTEQGRAQSITALYIYKKVVPELTKTRKTTDRGV